MQEGPASAGPFFVDGLLVARRHDECLPPASTQEERVTVGHATRSTAALLLALCAIGPVVNAVAQPADKPPEDSIVVTGKVAPSPTRAEVYDQAIAVSRVDPHAVYEEPLPRFHSPLCPGVVGLRDDYARAITERIRANAGQFKVPLATDRCPPNLLVAFVDDGQALLAALADEHPEIFTLVDPEERTELLTAPAPARVFTNVMARTSGAGGTVPNIPLPVRNGKQQRMSPRGQLDRTGLPTRKDIDLALVIYDKEATVGMTLEQLADYATMRGLSHTRAAEGNEAMATILSLFDEDGPRPGGPEQLTSFDIGYLRSAYAEAPNRSAVNRLLAVQREARKQARQEGNP
jgi:hypothetical protein